MNICAYFQAHVIPHEAWFFVGVLRSFEHLCFDRTLHKEHSIFEFFVPHELEVPFINLMTYFQDHGIVVNLKKMPNRLADAQAIV